MLSARPRDPFVDAVRDGEAERGQQPGKAQKWMNNGYTRLGLTLRRRASMRSRPRASKSDDTGAAASPPPLPRVERRRIEHGSSGEERARPPRCSDILDASCIRQSRLPNGFAFVSCACSRSVSEKWWGSGSTTKVRRRAPGGATAALCLICTLPFSQLAIQLRHELGHVSSRWNHRI